MSAIKEARKGKSEKLEKEKPRITTRARAKRSSNMDETILDSPASWPASAQKKRGKRLTVSTAELHSPGNAASNKVAALKNVTGERNVLKWGTSTPGTKDRKSRKTSMSDKPIGFTTPMGKKTGKKPLPTALDAAKSSDKSAVSNDLVCVVKMHHCDATPKANARETDSRKTVQTPEKSSKKLKAGTVHSMKSIRLSKQKLSLSLDSQKPLQKYSTPSMLRKRKSLPSDKSPSKRLSIDTKHVLRRFSKSPKIVLRSPKPKSKSKSKSPKLNVAKKSYFSKDVGKRRSDGDKSKKERREKMKKPGKENKETMKSISVSTTPKTTSPSITPRRSRPLAPLQQYEDILSRKPVVLLQRISLIKSVNAKANAGGSVRVGSKETENSPEKGTGERFTRKRLDLLTDESSKATEPLMSSTPHDEKKRQPRETSGKERKASPSNNRSNRSITGTNSSMVKSPGTHEPNGDVTMIEDESEPSLCNLNSFELSKQQKSISKPKTPSRRNSSRLRKESPVASRNEQKSPERNVTYELLEPKTPSLRKKAGKRSFREANLSDMHSKKTPKVRFTPSRLSLKNIVANIKQRDKVPSRQSPSVSRSRDVPLRRSPMQNSKSVKSLMKPATQPRIVIVTPSPTKTSMTLATKSVSATKYSATKKAPNFSRIHKKLFSQAESVIDAKRRLEERHRTLTRTSRKTASPAGSSNGISAGQSKNCFYTRFGYRLTKSDATNYMTRKGQLQSREKQKQESRELLRGVRMNRRFELQMRARKMGSI